MSARYIGRIVALCCVVAAFASCGDEPPVAPEMGIIVVSVLNNSTVPVPDVEVSLSGTNLVGRTDRDGKVVFRVASGRYFVDAQVCCVGPGFIEHHKAVRIIEGKTVEVVLEACLECV